MGETKKSCSFTGRPYVKFGIPPEYAPHTFKDRSIMKDGVLETAEQCRRLGTTVHTYEVDCSQREDIYRTAEKVKNEVGDVSILVNNAGVVVCTELLNIKDDQIQRTFDVNIMAHFWTTKAFLPAMLKNNHGHVVTVASICGHLPLPQLVDYCSSKFAAVGFHIALTAELAGLGKNGIKTSCLCPVFINTGFVRNPRSRLWPILKPEYVVKELMDGILTNKKMIFAPPSARFFVLMERIFPERFMAAVNKLQDAYCEGPVQRADKEK